MGDKVKMRVAEALIICSIALSTCTVLGATCVDNWNACSESNDLAKISCNSQTDGTTATPTPATTTEPTIEPTTTEPTLPPAKEPPFFVKKNDLTRDSGCTIEKAEAI